MSIIVLSIIALITFITFLFFPSKITLFIAILGFGTAQSLYTQNTQTALYLYPIYLILVTAFYAYSVIRDWKETRKKERLKRFKVRAFRYYRATAIILIVGFIVALISSFISYLQ